MIERNVHAKTHGRYLVDAPEAGMPLLAGFHGYAEAAETEFARLRTIEGSGRWAILVIQALHRFYRGRSTDVVAGWMTRQDRELAIADNIEYTCNVIDSVSREWSTGPTLVLSGFSQGVAMAFRCAINLARPVRGLIALGGDVPPELDASALARIPSVLIGRGTRDEWYTTEKLASDESRLRSSGVNVEVLVFDGGHEWTAEFGQTVSRFLSF